MTWNILEHLRNSLSAVTRQTASRRHATHEREDWGIQIETLEIRVVPSALQIRFDYSMDTNHFFDTQEKKDLLQSVANLFSDRLTDNLLAITPSGSNKWSAIFTNPGTGAQATVKNLSIAADTIVVYVGGRDLGDGTLGIGGPGGYSDSGSSTWLATVDRRGQAGAAGSHPTDFGPWGGSITFDSVGTDWYFGSTAPSPGSEQHDFVSVAMHELGHVLGFGTADSFDALISNGKFTGPKSVAAYDFAGNPPVADDDSHWDYDTTDGGQETAMAPSIAAGVRKLFTELDWAALDDLGWQANPIVRPTITLPGSIPTFIRGGVVATLDSSATFTNSDALRLSGSKLQAAVTANAGKYDFVSITIGGGITKSGASLKFNGVTIGSYSNGSGTKPFVLTFNSKATDAAVQACLRNLTFSTTSRKALTLDRTVTVALLNAGGENSVPVNKTVKVV